MNFGSIDDLPDDLQKLLADLLEKFQSLDPEQLQQLMQQFFGKQFVENLEEIFKSGQPFNMKLDPSMISKIQEFMHTAMDGVNPTDIPFENDKPPLESNVAEEPYYEISDFGNGSGEIVVEMQGISDVRHVNWNVQQNVLSIEASSEDVKYIGNIPIPDNAKIHEFQATLRNGVFILPFSKA